MWESKLRARFRIPRVARWATVGSGIFVVVGIIMSGGCTMTAPIHTWRNPKNESGVNSRIAIGSISGSPETTARLRESLEASKPQHFPDLQLVSTESLEQGSEVRLASFNGNLSDIAVINAAKANNVDLILNGHVIREDLEDDFVNPKVSLEAAGLPGRVNSMVIGWEVVDAKTGLVIDSLTDAIDSNHAQEVYPELALAGKPSDKVIVAMARKAWNTLVPHIESTNAELALPWFTLGARRIRKGNGYARQGRWDLAEEEWLQVVKRYPFSRAAWHNLAMAAVAKEDFQLASQRLQKADWAWRKSDRADRSLVWLEAQQRQYHEAFGLPDPIGGWKIPRSAEVIPSKLDFVEPRDIEDLPWWSGIPFVKPPEWSWRAFLTQPIPL